MSVVLGKCPHCGNDVIGGKYGAYCSSKCGFTMSKAFGRDLTEEEITRILSGEEILLNGLVSKRDDGSTHEYDMYVKADGCEEYQFTKKDGTAATGYRVQLIKRFPDKESGTPAEVLGKCPNCGKDVIEGKFGAFCKDKCGFSIAKAFKKELSKEQIKDILSGKEVLLKGLVKEKEDGSETKYDMYIKPDGTETYEYTKKDGSAASGIRMKFTTRFPGQDGGGIKPPVPAPAPAEEDVIEDELPFR